MKLESKIGKLSVNQSSFPKISRLTKVEQHSNMTPIILLALIQVSLAWHYLGYERYMLTTGKATNWRRLYHPNEGDVTDFMDFRGPAPNR